MFTVNIINYIKGYLVISAEGCFLERFINICARRGILLRDIKRTGQERLTAKISIEAFLQIRSVAFKTRTRICILQRRGIVFWLKQYKKRRFALFALILAAALFWYSTNHVMGIDIIGCEKMNADEIMDGLNEYGIDFGAPLRKINTDELQNRLMIKFEGVAWAGINIRGSRVYVEIKERLDKADILEQDTPCNLIAAKEGEITEIDARNGQSMVNVGDGVKAGDLLVSGVMDSSSKGARLVHAFGEVYAKTSYEKSTEVPLEYDMRENTGQVKNRYTINILKLKIPLYLNKKAPYAYYDEAVSKKEYRSPTDALPSVFIQKDSYFEQTSQKLTRSESEAVSWGAEQLKKMLDKELTEGVTVLNISEEHSLLSNGNVLVTIKYECEENIAEQALIDKIDING